MNINTAMRQGDPDSACRHHAYEATMPTSVHAIIEAMAPELWQTFQGFGYSAGLDCSRVTSVWARALAGVGISVELLRTGGLPGYPSDRGGYLREFEHMPWPHAYFALGQGRWLFDPTWSQFRSSGPPTLERYLSPGGIAYVEWREKNLRTMRA